MKSKRVSILDRWAMDGDMGVEVLDEDLLTMETPKPRITPKDYRENQYPFEEALAEVGIK